MKDKINEDSNNCKKNNFKTIIIIVGIIVILIVIGIFIYAKVTDNCTNNINSNYNFYSDPQHPYLDKPIIYLYPTEETEISVKLGSPFTNLSESSIFI